MDRSFGVRLQHSGARDGTPEEVCRRQVAEADVYVGVIGHLHGSRPSGSELSYTEIEYDEATKRGNPRLLFVAAEDLPLAPAFREPDEMWERQSRFRAKILEERAVKTFREPEELAAMVVAALQRHQVEVAGEAAASEPISKETSTTFFSYSREDSEFVLRLAQDLRQEGANVWLDQLDIGPGQRWDSAVEEALRGSPRQVAILSPAAVSSVNVMDEVSFALEEKKQIIPVLYRDCQIPLRLRRLQHIDFRTDYDRGLRELLKAWGVKEQAEAPTKAADVAAAAKTEASSKRLWIVVGAVGVLAVVLGIWYMATNHPAGGDAAAAQQSATTVGGTLAKAAKWTEVSRLTHQGGVHAVAFSADGRRVATGSSDETARVFEAASGKEVARLIHQGRVNAVAFRADGRYVATGSDDKTARVFEAATGKEVVRLTLEGGVNAVAFSADGRYVATGSDDKTARVFEAASGKEVVRLTHEGAVNAVAFNTDGRYVATGSDDKTARVFEAASGKEVARLTHNGQVDAVAFSMDGRYVATGSWDHTARVFEAASGKEVARLTHENYVYAVAFSADARYVATASNDQTARVFEAASGKEVARLTHQGTVNAVAFSADGRYVATGSEALSADGHYVAGKTARVFDVASGQEVAGLAHGGEVYAVAFSADGRYLATGSRDQTARVFEAQIKH
jgi:WD40 repeat protein